MASDQDIANGVASLLRQYDPNAVPSLSVNGVVQQLEAKLGLDLSDRASFIRELILRFHQKDHFTLHHPPQFPNSHPNPHPHHPHHPHHHHHNPPPSIPSNPFPPPPVHHHELAFRLPPQQQQQQQQPQPSQPQQQPQPSQQQPQPLQQQTQPSVAAAAAAPAASVPESPKESTQSGGKRRGGPGGLNKVCGVSPQLQTIVGAPTMPRTEIVKQLWAYIRKNNLQDPSNKRKIICDDPLRLVFETDCTDMFKMNKLLAKHIIPLDPKEPGAKRLKAAEVESAPQRTEPGLSPIVISDMLAKFFGTGEREMLQSEAVRRVWEYIKVNHLEFQDPMNMNGMIVRCDMKLQGLFGCESLPAMRIQEILMRHHFFRQS
ncbi:uncharacterized protein LOC131219554 [Magnolia sinica]|uniref:uncharacterized protein LOC131219554 n=1 Tax=Magnolia sinica TaxID=86752 RepID=UPI002659EFD6|nr:uncharacterized protein LOC131219554 [Magnolia sinica]XP_058070737.1 uncharacterized protein LOC131219554 [Magnolia sinica]